MAKPLLGELKREHTELTARVRESEDPSALIHEMEIFLKELKFAGKDIPPGDERELLRTFAAHWAGQIFEYSDTGRYPSPDLDPYTGTPTRLEIWRDSISPSLELIGRIPPALLFGILLVAVVAVAAAVLGPIDRPIFPSPSVTPVAATPSVPVPTVGPTFTATATPVPTGTLQFNTPTPTPPLPTGIEALFISPSDGQEIFPTTILRGTYGNFNSGWMIYPVLQPISEAGKLYPVDAPFTVLPGMQSGTWEVDPKFFSRPEIADGEQYNIHLAVALDDRASRALDALVVQGFGSFDELPPTVIRLPTVVTVSIGLFDEVDEVRLVYVQQSEDMESSEILTSLTDGSDIRQITFSPELGELEPKLSPDGEKIAYVGRRRTEAGGLAYSLQIVDASGRNSKTLFDEAGVLYDRPAWSPDGRFIAFGARIQEGSDLIWQVFIHDLAAGETAPVASGFTSLLHPTWFPDGRALLLEGWSLSTETWGIFKLDLETGTVGTIYDTEAHEIHPELSRDGNLLAFVTFPDGTTAKNDIAVLDLTIREAQILTSDSGAYWEPTWHPDEDSIYFENFEASETASIWAVDVSGGGDRPIIDGAAFAQFPDLGRFSAFLPMSQ